MNGQLIKLYHSPEFIVLLTKNVLVKELNNNIAE